MRENKNRKREREEKITLSFSSFQMFLENIGKQNIRAAKQRAAASKALNLLIEQTKGLRSRLVLLRTVRSGRTD